MAIGQKLMKGRWNRIRRHSAAVQLAEIHDFSVATPLGVGTCGSLGTRHGQTMMTNTWFAMRPIALPTVRQTRLGPTFDPIAELQPQCLLLAQSGHSHRTTGCPLLGVKRTSIGGHPDSRHSVV
jgi:hypothetical protein